MKLQDILASLMMDDTYKGRGKYHSKVRAVLQAGVDGPVLVQCK